MNTGISHVAKFVACLGGAFLFALAPAVADDQPQDKPQDKIVWHQSTSLMGDPYYKDGFAHFDYVNPDAPKGGIVRLSTTGSFDTFNPILPQGETAVGLGNVFETLLTPSLDETSTEYGLLAEALSYPDDFSSVTYRLRANAKWQDGEPVTPEDVVWSYQKLIELNPNRANYYANITGVEITGERDIKFNFDTTGNRELPQIIGQVAILPKHWWLANDPDGKPRDISKSTLEPPLGSGPYRLASFDAGKTLTYERVPDYWGANEPVNIGQNNFDTIKYEAFRDTTIEFEAFKGDQFDWWEENIARRWATGYDIAPVKNKQMLLERFENPYRGSGIMVAMIPNLRRPQFADPKVREALLYCFDFEEMRQRIFFGEYTRINSYFFLTELASSGLPEGQELDMLNAVRDKVPPRVFTEPYENPVGGDPAKLRDNLRKALSLLNEAGYTLEGSALRDKNGTQLAFEMLLNGPTIEPVALAFADNLKKIGIDATVRSVDSPQYINRVNSRDYDMIYNGWRQSLSPGNEQRFFFGSQSANEENSSNFAGIADPGIDALIDKVIFAEDRPTLVAATHALDRALLANFFVIPSYTITNARIAHWDRFSHPDTLPKYSIGFPTTWWYDAEKAAAIK